MSVYLETEMLLFSLEKREILSFVTMKINLYNIKNE